MCAKMAGQVLDVSYGKDPATVNVVVAMDQQHSTVNYVRLTLTDPLLVQ